MTRADIAALLATTAEAWPWARIEPAQAEIWHRSLETTPADDALETMLDLVRTMPKPPSIAEFLAHKRSRAYWRQMRTPQAGLEPAPHDRYPTDADERHARGAVFVQRCRDALAACTPPDRQAPRPPVVAPSVSDFDPDNAT